MCLSHTDVTKESLCWWCVYGCTDMLVGGKPNDENILAVFPSQLTN